MTATNDLQADELTALQSIFDPAVLFLDHSADYVAGFIATEQFESRETTLKIDTTELKVDYLPPVCLRFRCVKEYPESSPPIFDLRCCWLPFVQLDQLKSELLNIFNENLGSPILFAWIQHVQDSLGAYLERTSQINIFNGDSSRRASLDRSFCKSENSPVEIPSGSSTSEICNPSKNDRILSRLEPGNLNSLPIPGPLFRRYAPVRLAKLLSDYDREAKRRHFEASDYSCDVCFTDFMGRNGIAFEPCGHVFCKDCAKGYFDVQIRDGCVHALKCMADKCDSVAQQYQVKAIVDDKTFARYDGLQLSRGLDSMSDVVQCPRPWCRAPVILEPNDGSLGMCGTCDMTFCIHCNATYHGIAPCKISKDKVQELLQEYESATGDARVVLEQRYGRQRLQRMQEESAAEAWISENAKQCPSCNVGVEKADGCNKMTCYRCGQYFCWLCDGVIKSSNPYDHFNAVGGGCYNRLFEGVDDEGDWF